MLLIAELIAVLLSPIYFIGLGIIYLIWVAKEAIKYFILGRR